MKVIIMITLINKVCVSESSINNQLLQQLADITLQLLELSTLNCFL